MHEVYLGDLELYNAESVDTTSEREIKEYTGLSSGAFLVAREKKLRTWSVKLETGDSELLEELERMLKSSDPIRYVVYSDDYKLSASAMVESVSKSEKYAGIYTVTVKLREYKHVGVRTTDIPYVERPGKVPELPKTNESNTSHNHSVPTPTDDPFMAKYGRSHGISDISQARDLLMQGIITSDEYKQWEQFFLIKKTEPWKNPTPPTNPKVYFSEESSEDGCDDAVASEREKLSAQKDSDQTEMTSTQRVAVTAVFMKELFLRTLIPFYGLWSSSKTSSKANFNTELKPY